MLSPVRAQELELIGEELEYFRQRTLPETSDFPGEVCDALSYIHEHLYDPGLSVKTLKNHCGIHDNNASLRFRWVVGSSMREYIEGLRMCAASRLLRQSDCGVFDIALSVGYSYPQTFYRAFEKTYDCTPGRFRRRLRRSQEGGVPG